LEKACPNGAIFQQTDKFFKESRIKRLEWPGNSPHLNIIEDFNGQYAKTETINWTVPPKQR
jgi:hypothetical protein